VAPASGTFIALNYAASPKQSIKNLFTPILPFAECFRLQSTIKNKLEPHFVLVVSIQWY